MSDFKKFYFIVTADQKWSRSMRLKDAISKAVGKRKVKFAIYIGIVADVDDKVVQNIMNCFNVNEVGGLSMYENPTKEDAEMVRENLFGWMVDDSYIQPQKKK